MLFRRYLSENSPLVMEILGADRATAAHLPKTVSFGLQRCKKPSLEGRGYRQ